MCSLAMSISANSTPNGSSFTHAVARRRSGRRPGVIAHPQSYETSSFRPLIASLPDGVEPELELDSVRVLEGDERPESRDLAHRRRGNALFLEVHRPTRQFVVVRDQEGEVVEAGR